MMRIQKEKSIISCQSDESITDYEFIDSYL